MTAQGFVGVDPGGVVGLAALAEDSADRLTATARRLGDLLDRFRPGTARIGDQMRSAAGELAEFAANMRWRARVIAAQASVVSNSLVEFAFLTRFRHLPVPDLLQSWRTLPDPAELAEMSPSAVAAAFTETAPAIAEDFARWHPRLIGSLDGAPLRLRYAANRILIQQHVEELEQMLAGRDQPGATDWAPPWLLPNSMCRHFAGGLPAVAAERISVKISRYRSWIREDRQILLFDPEGDGRIAEVFGDLEVAEHVAVVVPGMANDLEKYTVAVGGSRDSAARLHAATAELGPAATIAWLGYDTPDGADATLRRAAAEGAPALRRFTAGLDPGGSRHLTVIAHSYGSVLAGIAAGDMLPVDDLVVVGSPGTTLAERPAARLRPGGRVWAALAESDPIAAGISPKELPPWWLPGALGPIWFAVDMSNGAEELWHGVNPASPEFGALRFSTDGSTGHSEYFEGRSLHNLALITTGHYTEVDLID